MDIAQLVNGRPGQVDAADRGLAYGDGVFETIAVLDGRPRFLAHHQGRLARGLDRLGIGFSDGEALWAEVHRLAKGRGRAVIKIIVTRGTGPRGYRAPQGLSPNRIVSVGEWPAYPHSYYTAGVAVRFCDLRLGHCPRLAGIKHLNRLEQVLARAEWNDERWAEGLLQDQDGHLVSGTMSNLFLVRDKFLLTPLLDRCGVAGVMRRVIMDKAAGLGLQVREQRISLRSLEQAEELFLTNSLIGIWPVGRVGEQRLSGFSVARNLTQHLGLVP